MGQLMKKDDPVIFVQALTEKLQLEINYGLQCSAALIEVRHELSAAKEEIARLKARVQELEKAADPNQ